jgi:hypothetical protein
MAKSLGRCRNVVTPQPTKYWAHLIILEDDTYWYFMYKHVIFIALTAHKFKIIWGFNTWMGEPLNGSYSQPDLSYMNIVFINSLLFFKIIRGKQSHLSILVACSDMQLCSCIFFVEHDSTYISSRRRKLCSSILFHLTNSSLILRQIHPRTSSCQECPKIPWRPKKFHQDADFLI